MVYSLSYTIQRDGGSYIVLYYSNGRRVIHSLSYTIQREGRRFIQLVTLFMGKEGDWFNWLDYSK